MSETGKRENRDQIPKEDDTQGQTGKVISDQNAIEGLRKEVAVESYSLVAEIGQLLKDLEFPADKSKIINYIKSSDSSKKEDIVSALDKIENRPYKNVSEVTMAAGLVH